MMSTDEGRAISLEEELEREKLLLSCDFGEPQPAEIDMWSFDLMQWGRRLKCTSLTTFVYYACSPKTVALKVTKHNAARHAADMIAIGPEAWEEGYLWVKWEVSGKEMLRIFPEDLCWIFGEALMLLTDQKTEDPFFKSPRSGEATRRILGLPLLRKNTPEPLPGRGRAARKVPAQLGKKFPGKRTNAEEGG